MHNRCQEKLLQVEKKLRVEKNERSFVFTCGENNVRINLKLITDAYEVLIKMLHSLPDVD